MPIHNYSLFDTAVNGWLMDEGLSNISVRFEIGLFRNDEEIAAAEGTFVHDYVTRGEALAARRHHAGSGGPKCEGYGN